MTKPTIALLTDFGLDDYYVGVMKGVITSINTNVSIIDINHNIPQGNIRKGAYQLLASYKYFPPQTIFVIVIDPSVGTSRKAIIVKTEEYFFISPDNGLLTYVLEYLGNDNIKIIEISNQNYILSNKSNTFHGRDVFAPISAHLSLNNNIEIFGNSINNIVKIQMHPIIKTKNFIKGSLFDIDRFGNLITNIPSKVFEANNIREISIKEIKLENLAKTYNDVKTGQILALIGSSGYLEISVNQGNAQNFLKIDYNDIDSLEIYCKF